MLLLLCVFLKPLKNSIFYNLKQYKLVLFKVLLHLGRHSVWSVILILTLLLPKNEVQGSGAKNPHNK